MGVPPARKLNHGTELIESDRRSFIRIAAFIQEFLDEWAERLRRRSAPGESDFSTLRQFRDLRKGPQNAALLNGMRRKCDRIVAILRMMMNLHLYISVPGYEPSTAASCHHGLRSTTSTSRSLTAPPSARNPGSRASGEPARRSSNKRCEGEEGGGIGAGRTPQDLQLYSSSSLKDTYTVRSCTCLACFRNRCNRIFFW